MKTITISSENCLSIRNMVALGASAIASNYADSFIRRPHRTRGTYLKALSVVQYDRAYDKLGKVLSIGGAA